MKSKLLYNDIATYAANKKRKEHPTTEEECDKTPCNNTLMDDIFALPSCNDLPYDGLKFEPILSTEMMVRAELQNKYKILDSNTYTFEELKENLQLKPLLGVGKKKEEQQRGSFGEIYETTICGIPVVFKHFHEHSEETKGVCTHFIKTREREVEAIREFQKSKHPFFPKFYSMVYTNVTEVSYISKQGKRFQNLIQNRRVPMGFFMEKLESSLENFDHQFGQPGSLDQFVKILLQCFMIPLYLSSHGMLHNDFYSRNICIRKLPYKENLHYKISKAGTILFECFLHDVQYIPVVIDFGHISADMNNHVGRAMAGNSMEQFERDIKTCVNIEDFERMHVLRYNFPIWMRDYVALAHDMSRISSVRKCFPREVTTFCHSVFNLMKQVFKDKLGVIQKLKAAFSDDLIHKLYKLSIEPLQKEKPFVTYKHYEIKL